MFVCSAYMWWVQIFERQHLPPYQCLKLLITSSVILKKHERRSVNYLIPTFILLLYVIPANGFE